MRDDTGAVSDGLIDVTGMSLRDLDDGDESAQSSLDHALRWVLNSDQDRAEPIAGFSASI